MNGAYGYRETTVVAGKTTLEAFAHDVAALLDALRVSRVVVAGLHGRVGAEHGFVGCSAAVKRLGCSSDESPGGNAPFFRQPPKHP